MRQKSSTSEISNRNKKAKAKRLTTLKLFIVLCAVIWLIGAYFISGTNKTANTGQVVTGYIEVPASTDITNASMCIGQSSFTADFQMLTYQQLVEVSNDHLLLINNQYGIPENISEDLKNVSDYVWTLNKNLVLNGNALEMLEKLFDSAANAGHNEFRVTEGHRTYEQQKSLYDSEANKPLVALAGYSEHQTGLAADVSYHGVNIGNSQQGKWLMENAYKFGFILRYPQHKTDITGFPFEPWHYRYVGQSHSYFIQRNDFALEEYIDYLKKHEVITIDFNGIVYRVHYLTNSGETIEIPFNYSYSTSSDNTGGVIVTIWQDK